jgi:tetratricopeptide (TPR) repeat protein
MIILFLAAAAAAAPPASPEQARFEACSELVDSDAAKGLEEANAWRLMGGGVMARQCEGLAYAALRRWLPAVTAFEAAAREADTKGDGRAASLWVQAGNAALVANDPARARVAFDAALARGQATGADLGEIHLDRARARFAGGDKPGTREDIDLALKLVPADPLAWLLSATLARETGDLVRAGADIGEAQKRSPDDAQVALEAGNIAILSGSEDAARTAWTTAVKVAPESAAGKAAREALARLANPG